MKNVPITLHFEIKPNGRTTIHWKKGDTFLVFKNRKPTTYRAIGEAFIKLADKAEWYRANPRPLEVHTGASTTPNAKECCK